MKVVLLHALPLDERMWEAQLDLLEGHDAIAPRLYGRGNTMDAWADSIAAELDGELVVVGASMGGYCALALARRAPERLRAVMLAGSRPDADTEERRAARADTIELIRKEGPEGLWRMMAPKLFADVSSADKSLLYRDADGLVAAVEAIRDREDSTAVVRSLGDRLEFVIGDFDPYVSPQELTEFTVSVIAGVAHLPSLERPDEFNQILHDFLDRV